MNLRNHFAKCFLAGIVALLPVGGLVLAVAYFENMLSESWRGSLPFYFPGMGLLLATILIYLLGLVVSSVIGRWLWKRVDTLLDRLPALGSLYKTLKQILGYGSGEDAIFLRVVTLKSTTQGGEELGLVTRECTDGDPKSKLIVFMPGCPNPTIGRLVMLDPAMCQDNPMPVSEAFKALLSTGKSGLE